jgi:hypothetical protein
MSTLPVSSIACMATQLVYPGCVISDDSRWLSGFSLLPGWLYPRRGRLDCDWAVLGDLWLLASLL